MEAAAPPPDPKDLALAEYRKKLLAHKEVDTQVSTDRERTCERSAGDHVSRNPRTHTRSLPCRGAAVLFAPSVTADLEARAISGDHHARTPRVSIGFADGGPGSFLCAGAHA